MINSIEVGKIYRFTGSRRPRSWNSRGLMDVWLDGKPRKCLYIMTGLNGSANACFEGVPRSKSSIGTSADTWAYSKEDFALFEVVTNEEV